MVAERGMDSLMRSTLAAVAPGTELRDGLERILRGRTGALIVLGHDETVERLCSGGFPLDVEFSATRLRELAKMDGAVVVDSEIKRITRAAVQLMPDAAIPTAESGTRHRTAERVAKQTGFPVLSVSQSMRMVALYVGDQRYVVEAPDAKSARAHQALATLERYKYRLDEVSEALSHSELDSTVTVRDVALVLQRLEMVRRIRDEIAMYVIELGSDGRLLSLQLEDLLVGLIPSNDLVIRDYLHATDGASDVQDVLLALADLDSTRLVDLADVVAAMGFMGGPDALDLAVSPRGYRLLSRVPRLPAVIIDRLVDHFGDVPKLLAAGMEDLMAVEGVGEQRARTIRDGLYRAYDQSRADRRG